MKKILIKAALWSGATYLLVESAKPIIKKLKNRRKKILFIVSSHGQLGNTGEHTGYYLSEVAHPWKVLTKAGYKIDFVSPKGGTPPVDGFQLIDPINKKFWNNQKYQKKILTSMTPTEVNPDQYCAIFYAGGHGAMWDFPPNTELADITRHIYETGGIVAAVCHGPAGLVNVRLSNGEHLIKGKRVTGFTNEEERMMKRENIVPFLLENMMKERQSLYEKGLPMTPYVVTDGRVITGQNPMSAKAVGKSILWELQTKNPIIKEDFL